MLTICVSIGAHWAILQSVAWCGMVINYSQESSVKEGLAKTFDGKHPCCLCKAIAEGKKSEKKSEALSVLKKIEMIHFSTLAAWIPARDFILLPEQQISFQSFQQSPPVPPPRFV